MKDFVPAPELNPGVRDSDDTSYVTPSSSDSAQAMRAALSLHLDEPRAEAHWHVPPAVPDHQLLQRIGTGAYGEVWLGRNALGTLRAVKVVYGGRFEDERPYLREFHGILKYEPVSRSHEGLVAVLHVGRNDEAGCFYYVMELADNARGKPSAADSASGNGGSRSVPEAAEPYAARTLKSEMAERHRLSPVEAAQLALRMAGALAHLHANGLVHRDIKPSNVIFVQGKPKLADIGLVTGAGDSRSFVGTEGFIPPEGPGTVQADLYGLGKLLYELVTGQDRLDFPQLPPELREDPNYQALLEINEVIVRACTPQLEHRYKSATELISDLNLFLAGRSLRQARKIERHLAWFKRFAAVGAIVLALASGAVWWARADARAARERERASHERARMEATLRQRAETAEREQSRLREDAQAARANEARLRGQAEAQELTARKRAYASDMNLLQQALAMDDLGRAQELLDRQRPKPGESDLRGWEWRYFWQFCQSDTAFTLCRRSASIVSVSFSSDNALLAVGAWDGELTVWDVATRGLLFSTNAPANGHCRAAFAPGGRLLAFYRWTDDRPEVVLWDADRQAEVRRLPLQSALRNLAFAPDGHLFTADFGSTNNIIEWDPASGTVLSRSTAPIVGYEMGTVFNLAAGGGWAYAPAEDSHSIVAVDGEGRRGAPLRVAEELVTAMTFSPDGQTLYTGEGYANGEVKEWDLKSRQLIDTFGGHRSWVSCLKFLPDGKRLASASADHTIRIWDTQTHQLLRTLRGHNGELWTIDVSPDGQWLASGCKDGSVILWNLNSSTSRPPAFRTVNQAGATFWTYSTDSRWCGVVRDRRLEFYDAKTLEPLTGPNDSLTNIYTFAFLRDGRVVTAQMDGTLSAWTFPSLSRLTNFPVQATDGGVAVTCLGSNTVLTLGADNLNREWDTSTWQEIGGWNVPAGRAAIALSAGTRLTAFASESGAAELLTLQHPEQRRKLELQARLSGVALSPDGSILASSSENGTLELWDTEKLTRTALLHGALLGYHSVFVSPDGTRLVAGSNGQEAIKIWDLRSHEELATLPGHGSFFRRARFSPDGNTISACNWNGVIHFWTAPPLEQIEKSRL